LKATEDQVKIRVQYLIKSNNYAEDLESFFYFDDYRKDPSKKGELAIRACSICQSSTVVLRGEVKKQLYSSSESEPITLLKDVRMRSEEDEVSDKHYHPTSLPLQSQRYLSDISHYDHGLYVHKLVNKGKHPIDSIFLQDWFMNNFRPHMQSLTLFRKRAGSSFTEEYSLYSLERGRSDLKFDANIQYSATSDSHITMSLRGDKAVLQPDDSLMITFEVRKALRNFEEYPNDIARGLNIPHMPIYYTEEAQG